MSYFDLSTATSFGVPQADGSMQGYTFDNPSSFSEFPAMSPNTFVGPTQSPSTAPAQSGGTTPSPLNPSTWKIPSLSDVFKGMTNGPNGATPTSGLSGAIDQYVGRIAIIVLGIIFVAIGLVQFKPAMAIVSTVKDKVS